MRCARICASRNPAKLYGIVFNKNDSVKLGPDNFFVSIDEYAILQLIMDSAKKPQQVSMKVIIVAVVVAAVIAGLLVSRGFQTLKQGQRVPSPAELRFSNSLSLEQKKTALLERLSRLDVPLSPEEKETIVGEFGGEKANAYRFTSREVNMIIGALKISANRGQP